MTIFISSNRTEQYDDGIQDKHVYHIVLYELYLLYFVLDKPKTYRNVLLSRGYYNIIAHIHEIT